MSLGSGRDDQFEDLDDTDDEAGDDLDNEDEDLDEEDDDESPDDDLETAEELEKAQQDLATMSEAYEDLIGENAKLKAENERLRKRLKTPSVEDRVDADFRKTGRDPKNFGKL